MDIKNKVTTVKRNQFIEILNKVANELNVSVSVGSVNELIRYSDRQKTGVRVKFVGYYSKEWGPVFKQVTEILNEVDGGGWEVDNGGGCYGEGWNVIKLYKD